MNDMNIPQQEGYYTTDLKVKRPPKMVAEAPASIPKRKLFSPKEADKKLQAINNDIYMGTQKEKQKHEFNRNLYFKIFGGVTLATAGIAGIGRIRDFFRKS